MQEDDKNNNVLIPKDCNHDFVCWLLIPEFLLPWGCHVTALNQLPLAFQFKMVYPGFILHDSLQQEALTFCIILA